MTKIVHHNVMCKECLSLSGYVTGWRHKCLNCADYDLCEICFRYTTHDVNHVFMTLKESCAFTPLQLSTPFFGDSPYLNKVVGSPRARFDDINSYRFKPIVSLPSIQHNTLSTINIPNNSDFTLLDILQPRSRNLSKSSNGMDI